MAKKKPVAQEFNTVDMKDGKPVSAAETVKPETVLDDISSRTGDVVKVKDDIKEKLAAYEKMEKSLSELAHENAALKDKIAEYVEEISQLREAAATPKVVEKEVVKEVIKEVPAEMPCGETAAEMAALRKENDEHLIKISELTFENARLTAEINELSKTAAQPRPEPPKVQPYPNVYRNSARLNGYSEWN